MTTLIKKRKPKDDGRIVINISFTENEYDLINHVDSCGNFSQYVKRLIAEDMNKQNNPQLNENTLGLLLQMIQNGQVPAAQQSTIQQNMSEPKPQEQKADINKVQGILKGLKG